MGNSLKFKAEPLRKDSAFNPKNGEKKYHTQDRRLLMQNNFKSNLNKQSSNFNDVILKPESH